jgi:hypothetical protein
MATICPYPGRKCVGCEHRRIDEDLGSYSCFVKQDLAAAAPQQQTTGRWVYRYKQERSVVFTPECFVSEETWKELCEHANIKPEETAKIKVYFEKVEMQKKAD